MEDPSDEDEPSEQEELEVPPRREADMLRNVGPGRAVWVADSLLSYTERELAWHRFNYEQVGALNRLAYQSGNSDAYLRRARHWLDDERAAGRLREFK